MMFIKSFIIKHKYKILFGTIIGISLYNFIDIMPSNHIGHIKYKNGYIKKDITNQRNIVLVCPFYKKLIKLPLTINKLRKLNYTMYDKTTQICFETNIDYRIDEYESYNILNNYGINYEDGLKSKINTIMSLEIQKSLYEYKNEDGSNIDKLIKNLINESIREYLELNGFIVLNVSTKINYKKI